MIVWICNSSTAAPRNVDDVDCIHQHCSFASEYVLSMPDAESSLFTIDCKRDIVLENAATHLYLKAFFFSPMFLPYAYRRTNMKTSKHAIDSRIGSNYKRYR